MNSIRFCRWIKGPLKLMPHQGGGHFQKTFKRFSSTGGENRIRDILTEKLSPSSLRVIDVSGGCGSMYQIGKNTLSQHRMVNSILKEEIKGMHGLNLLTEVDEENSKDPTVSGKQ
ncbi:eukaryotic protein [Schizosaccharomyces cryophilus OY26]|uniref:Eukaryotic protein n=1 Tax=Schizosaccharomyces cryophilus (strain OY26 / ATCC MYA-4695 / CBS 11777 / NBRC 106824 / NRRL Y48691) TaxID=653667 RepID=S9VWF5_SCHCR|nr:uncharacterized protein SPOG_00878 [Schizosaccharomyces cryophilus OY26]EPY50579.1 eukaryotic protein [Schizosaccharomyces cryophilus OY26]